MFNMNSKQSPFEKGNLILPSPPSPVNSHNYKSFLSTVLDKTLSLGKQSLYMEGKTRFVPPGREINISTDLDDVGKQRYFAVKVSPTP